jgi:hypothetical protein
MSVVVLGERTVGEFVPAALSVNATLLADIQAKLAGAIALQARLVITPPSLLASIAAAESLLLNLKAALALGLPSASLDLTAMLKVIAALDLQVQEALSFNIAFGTGGVMGLAYTGTVGAMGAELGATVETLFPPTNDAVALVLIASDPATKIAMNLVFGVSL